MNMELKLIEGHPCKKRKKKHAQTDKEKKNKTIGHSYLNMLKIKLKKYLSSNKGFCQ